MAARARIDGFFLLTTASLAVAGFVIFLSASLGLLAQDGASFGMIALKQSLGLIAGGGLFYFFSRFKYTRLRRFAIFILIGAIAVNLLLFIPALTFHYNGASRWLYIGSVSIQPSELLKIAFIIYLAAWVQFAKDRIKRMKYSLLPYLALIGILGSLLLVQSDTDTLVIIAATGIAMLWIAGMPFRYVILAGAAMCAIVGGVIFFRPYALERVKVYLNIAPKSQDADYQIKQSLIAIGSGGALGRGFGQSIQKFGYLPQATDDSIFAVAAEEFGFWGMTLLIALYCAFAAAAFRVGARAEDAFGAMVASGFAVLVISESFLNMAAMLGLMPISGIPLLFISHGGTALVITLMAAGIVANISKYKK